jgi:hypothetical protein
MVKARWQPKMFLPFENLSGIQMIASLEPSI